MWGWRLLRIGYDAGTALWGAGFLAIATSAFLGGIVHGFQRRMGAARAAPLWAATLHLLAIASAVMLAAVIVSLTSGLLRAAALVLVVAKLFVAVGLLRRRARFRVVLVDYGVALGALVVLQGNAWWHHDAASAPWIVGGAAASVVAGAIQALRIAPHPRFNHNDLYHVVQIASLWALYRGGLLLGAA